MRFLIPIFTQPVVTKINIYLFTSHFHAVVTQVLFENNLESQRNYSEDLEEPTYDNSSISYRPHGDRVFKYDKGDKLIYTPNVVVYCSALPIATVRSSPISGKSI